MLLWNKWNINVKKNLYIFLNVEGFDYVQGREDSTVFSS